MNSCNSSTVPYCLTEVLVAAVNGDVENGLIFAGNDVHRIDKIVKVKDIFEELTGK